MLFSSLYTYIKYFLFKYINTNQGVFALFLLAIYYRDISD